MNNGTQRSSAVADEIARPHDNIEPPRIVQVAGSPKIKPEHLARGAALYIRQSSLHQLRENREPPRASISWAIDYLRWDGVEIR